MLVTPKIITGIGYMFYQVATLAPIHTFLDDEYSSIATYRDYCVEEKGCNVLITKDPRIMSNAFKEYGNKAAYSFDIKMNGAPSKIGKHDTFNGASVGPATICHITNNATVSTIKHCSALSEHLSDIAEAKNTLTELEKLGQLITRIEKSENIDEFSLFNKMYLEDYFNNIKPRLMKGDVEAVQSAYSEICNEKDFSLHLAALMGYVGSDVHYWMKHRDNISENANSDFKERIRTLRYIKSGLITFFGNNNTKAQKDWLYQNMTELGGKSAWDLLETGDYDDLRLVAYHVNQILG